jgi:Pvc16 N-terminal domain
MSDFRAISGVTKSLAAFLKARTGVDVNDEKAPSDAISDSTSLIHLYLYRVEYNPFFANSDSLVVSNTVLASPPIGLNLFYLVTPYGPSQLDIQVTLGEIIRVFNDQPSIPPANFDPSLTNVVEELKIIPHILTLDQMTELARVFGQRHYRLSMTYEVCVVLIDSTVTSKVTRVDERHISLETLR